MCRSTTLSTISEDDIIDAVGLDEEYVDICGEQIPASWMWGSECDKEKNLTNVEQ